LTTHELFIQLKPFLLFSSTISKLPFHTSKYHQSSSLPSSANYQKFQQFVFIDAQRFHTQDRQTRPCRAGGMPSLFFAKNDDEYEILTYFCQLTLPAEYQEVKDINFEYDFRVELDTIAQIHREREQEEQERIRQEEWRKQAELDAQAEVTKYLILDDHISLIWILCQAWKALEEEKQRRLTLSGELPSSPSLTPKNNDPNTLIDLDFEENRKLANKTY